MVYHKGNTYIVCVFWLACIEQHLDVLDFICQVRVPPPLVYLPVGIQHLLGFAHISTNNTVVSK